MTDALRPRDVWSFEAMHIVMREGSLPGHVWCDVIRFGQDMPCVLPNGHPGFCKDAQDIEDDEKASLAVYHQDCLARAARAPLADQLYQTQVILEAERESHEQTRVEAIRLTTERAELLARVRNAEAVAEREGHRARAAEGEMRAMKDALGAPEGLWRWLRWRFRCKQDEVQKIGEWALRCKDQLTAAQSQSYTLWAIATRVLSDWDSNPDCESIMGSEAAENMRELREHLNGKS